MAKQIPPTPPDINGHELQDGFHQIMQHNAKNQQQSHAYTGDNGVYAASGNAYNTPEPEAGQWYMDQYGNRTYMYHNQHHMAGDVQYVRPFPIQSDASAGGD